MRFFSKNSGSLFVLALAIGLAFPLALNAQTKKKPVKKTSAKPAVTTSTPLPEATPVTTPPADEPAKKNARGGEAPKTDKTPTVRLGTQYLYTFDRPGFTYSRIVIEHDDSGKGTISMKPDNEDEPLTDPIELTSKTLANLRKAFDALNFLDSTESYQYSRDYPHLGNVAITLTKNGRSRTAKFNWTENSNAKALMDEYRRLSNEYTWKLEMQSARENQPLLTPKLVEVMTSYIERDEISDPGHILPLLTELSSDERLPLIARNRLKKIAAKIIKESK